MNGTDWFRLSQTLSYILIHTNNDNILFFYFFSFIMIFIFSIIAGLQYRSFFFFFYSVDLLIAYMCLDFPKKMQFFCFLKKFSIQCSIVPSLLKCSWFYNVVPICAIQQSDPVTHTTKCIFKYIRILWIYAIFYMSYANNCLLTIAI